ncbi:MAG TPA: lipid-binding SYLF domain-containing protein [Gemmataceae bacterium]|nr:lipid-binding SYLF domain-containing protein [Gemmataceae bacterium]
MTAARGVLAVSLMLTVLAVPSWAIERELKTVESATEAVRELAAIPLKGIPQSLLQDAVGVAIVPHAVKTALVLEREFGRGVILTHEPNGLWSNPVFVTLRGRGIGGEAGIEKTDLVLVFKSHKALDRALKGKLTLGSDVAVAVGPVGRDAEVGRLKADVFSYSRSRGLFVGVSVEGAKLNVDEGANEDVYRIRGGRADDVLASPGIPVPLAVQTLKDQLLRLSMPGVAPPQVIVVPEPPPVPRR